MREKQHCSHQDQCRRRARDAPAAEQKFPSAKKRPMVEQPVPSSPWAPCTADLHVQTLEEPKMQHWTRPKGGCSLWKSTAGADPDQSCGEEPLVGLVGSRSSARAVPEGCALCYRTGAVFGELPPAEAHEDQFRNCGIPLEGPMLREQ